MEEQHLTRMRRALEEAQKAKAREEVPIGAVLVRDGEIIEAAGNRTREKNDPTAHAEIEVIRAVCAMDGAQRIPGTSLYVTLEPCAMCAAAISFARIESLYFGAFDPKGGGVIHGGCFFDQTTCHHRPKIIQGGVLDDECGAILRDFFKARR